MEGSGRILVVDDHAPNAEGLRVLLTSAGHTVRVARSGEEALRLVAEEVPDLVLLDVMMPGISGIDVCCELKSCGDTRLIPIVLITGSQDKSRRMEGLDAGADDFLTKPIDVQELRTRVRSLIRVKRLNDALESTEGIMKMLGEVVEARDPYTEGHCQRLAAYAAVLGTALGLDASDLDVLNRGAALHDIGKIAVPDSVLLKPGKLDPDEWSLMREHPVVGDNLCRTVRSLERVRPIVRSHHERLDGRGYPDQLRGPDIPLLAQIVGIVDVFDALTTERPYRKAMTTEAACEIMLKEAVSGWRRVEHVQQFIDLYRSRRDLREHARVPARHSAAVRIAVALKTGVLHGA